MNPPLYRQGIRDVIQSIKSEGKKSEIIATTNKIFKSESITDSKKLKRFIKELIEPFDCTNLVTLLQLKTFKGDDRCIDLLWTMVDKLLQKKIDSLISIQGWNHFPPEFLKDVEVTCPGSPYSQYDTVKQNLANALPKYLAKKQLPENWVYALICNEMTRDILEGNLGEGERAKIKFIHTVSKVAKKERKILHKYFCYSSIRRPSRPGLNITDDLLTEMLDEWGEKYRHGVFKWPVKIVLAQLSEALNKPEDLSPTNLQKVRVIIRTDSKMQLLHLAKKLPKKREDSLLQIKNKPIIENIWKKLGVELNHDNLGLYYDAIQDELPNAMRDALFNQDLTKEEIKLFIINKVTRNTFPKKQFEIKFIIALHKFEKQQRKILQEYFQIDNPVLGLSKELLIKVNNKFNEFKENRYWIFTKPLDIVLGQIIKSKRKARLDQIKNTPIIQKICTELRIKSESPSQDYDAIQWEVNERLILSNVCLAPDQVYSLIINKMTRDLFEKILAKKYDLAKFYFILNLNKLEKKRIEIIKEYLQPDDPVFRGDNELTKFHNEFWPQWEKNRHGPFRDPLWIVLNELSNSLSMPSTGSSQILAKKTSKSWEESLKDIKDDPLVVKVCKSLNINLNLVGLTSEELANELKKTYGLFSLYDGLIKALQNQELTEGKILSFILNELKNRFDSITFDLYRELHASLYHQTLTKEQVLLFSTNEITRNTFRGFLSRKKRKQFDFIVAVHKCEKKQNEIVQKYFKLSNDFTQDNTVISNEDLINEVNKQVKENKYEPFKELHAITLGRLAKSKRKERLEQLKNEELIISMGRNLNQGDPYCYVEIKSRLVKEVCHYLANKKLTREQVRLFFINKMTRKAFTKFIEKKHYPLVDYLIDVQEFQKAPNVNKALLLVQKFPVEVEDIKNVTNFKKMCEMGKWGVIGLLEGMILDDLSNLLSKK